MKSLFKKSFLAVAVGLVTWTFVFASGERPNIIFILCDDLGYGDLGCFYQNSRAQQKDQTCPAIATPHLDRFTSQGVKLFDHYTGSPVCVSARSSLLTGRTQGNAIIRDNAFDTALEDNHNLATVLKGAGYSTAAFGKWGLQGGGEKDKGGPNHSFKNLIDPQTPQVSNTGSKLTQDPEVAAKRFTSSLDAYSAHPLKRGFDYYFGYIAHRDGHAHYPEEDGKLIIDNAGYVKEDLSLCYTTDLFTARCKKWIVDQKTATPNQPFFIYLALDTPHAILQYPPSEYPAGGGLKGGVQWIGKSGSMINSAKGKYDSYCYPNYRNATWDHDKNPSTPAQEWPDVYRRYASGVARIDDTVGDLMQLLKDMNIDDKTLVVFTSDNGPSIESYINGADARGNSYKYSPEFFRSYAEFAGIKRDLLEGGCRVPTLARWPAQIPKGRELQEPSGFWDWMATFADIAGVPAPALTDGVSLVPSLTGKGDGGSSQVYLEYFNEQSTPAYPDFSTTHQGRKRNQMQMLRIGNFVGVRYDIKSADDIFEIYDVVKDPSERHNLAGSPELSQLQKQFQQMALQQRRASPAFPRPYDNAPVPALSLYKSDSGITWKTFQGQWPWLPKMDEMKPVATGTTSRLESSKIPMKDQNGLYVTGYLQVPKTGEYTFTLQSNGEHLFKIHNACVIDGGWKMDPQRVDTGKLILEKGPHPYRFYYSKSKDQIKKPDWKLEWTGPEMKTQAIQ